ncbi:radical SAM protein [Methanothermobacter sp. KEPCO 2]|uniref:radical SAM protein n=1 Tax=Methanothermobacter sp. KEPCO 2 TaxID=3240977 RepID=UPI003513190D
MEVRGKPFPGERGVCGAAETEIAYNSITDVLKSYSVTLLSCPFRCAYCNAYRISQYPDSGWVYRGYVKPEDLALEALRELEAHGISNLSFTGGEPTLHTLYIERMLHEIRVKAMLMPLVATNGFQTPETLKRIIRFTSLFSFEIKAFQMNSTET